MARWDEVLNYLAVYSSYLDPNKAITLRLYTPDIPFLVLALVSYLYYISGKNGQRKFRIHHGGEKTHYCILQSDEVCFFFTTFCFIPTLASCLTIYAKAIHASNLS
jgi:hypothetical protein